MKRPSDLLPNRAGDTVAIERERDTLRALLAGAVPFTNHHHACDWRKCKGDAHKSTECPMCNCGYQKLLAEIREALGERHNDPAATRGEGE